MSGKREERWFWAVQFGATAPRRVLGFTCAPEHPGAWWVPMLGSTMWEGMSLHGTAAVAVAAEAARIEASIAAAQARLTALRATASISEKPSSAGCGQP